MSVTLNQLARAMSRAARILSRRANHAAAK